MNVFHESRLEPKASPGGDLIARARRGEEAAFAALFEAHKRRVYGFCLRATGSPREAEKLAQEAFLRVFRKISTLRDESAFSAGLHRQAVNVLLMQLREKRLQQVRLHELDASSAGPLTMGMRHSFLIPTVLLVAFLIGVILARASYPPGVVSGFRLLYEMRFEEARSGFQAWEKVNPQDPLGHAWEAASYLFEEFYDHGVLTSEFFLDDRKLLGGVEGKPNDEYRAGFLAASNSAQELAKQRLAVYPKDPDALFALTITTGMLADYAALIEKRHLRSLKLMREAQNYAKDLQAVKPNSADAYLSLGAANYIIGCLPAHERFFLRLGGIKGDKRLGMTQLETAAREGQYLRPFAKILLALVALREKQAGLARTQLEELTTEFPRSPLFARELALLKKSADSAFASARGGS